MRKQFIETNDLRSAWDRCPWAAVIVAADGGFWAFESASDYDRWVNQQ